MKFLFRFMLTFLIVLCVAAGVIVVMYLSGDGDGDSISYGDNAQLAVNVSDGINVEEADDSYGGLPMQAIHSPNFPTPDGRRLQSGFTRHAGSDYWHFYPLVPADAVAGDMIVLSASARGFVRWEAVTDNVEFVNQSSDEDEVHVSLRMPNEQFIVVALYNETFVNNGQQTLGTGVSPLSTHPTTVGRLNDDIPHGMVGQNYSHIITPNEILDGMGDIEWTWRPQDAIDMPSFEFLEQQLRLETQANDTLRIYSFNGPLSVPVDFYIIITFSYTITTTTLDPDTGDSITATTPPISEPVPHRIVIHDGPPVIELQGTFLDGMVGVSYENNSAVTATGSSLIGNEWNWGADLSPAGLNIFSPELGSVSPAIIRGDPREHGLANFTVRLIPDPENPHFLPSAPLSFAINILERPVINSLGSAFNGGPILLPGMVDTLYQDRNRIDVINIPTGIADMTREWRFATFLPNETNGTWHFDTVLPDGTRQPITVLPNGLSINNYPASNLVSSELVARISGEPDKDGQTTFAVGITLTNPTNPNINTTVWSTEPLSTSPDNDRLPFSLRIFPLPEFTTAVGGLEHGMVATPRYPGNEPVDAPYTDTIQATGFFGDEHTTWVPTVTWLPPSATPSIIQNPFGGLLANAGNINTNVTFSYPDLETDPPIRTGDAEIEGRPEHAGLFRLTIRWEAANPENENIDGASIERTFDLRIWPRTYLYITMSSGSGFVGRIGENGKDEYGEENDWIWFDDTPERDLYEHRRAVMPGTTGIISAWSGGGFVRWEIDDTPGRAPPGTRPEPMKPATVAYLSPIGVNFDHHGPRNGTALNAYVKITMPIDERGTGEPVVGDVIIRGVQTNEPRISIHLPDGTVGATQYTGELVIDERDVGGGPNPISWRPVSHAQRPLSELGLVLRDSGQDFTLMTLLMNRRLGINVHGTPPQQEEIVGTFEFVFGLTLPGTMRLELTDSITINPRSGVILGAVNEGNRERDPRAINLTDLIMFARHINAPDNAPVAIDMDAARILSTTTPGPLDLAELYRWFRYPHLSDPNIIPEFLERVPRQIDFTPPQVSSPSTSLLFYAYDARDRTGDILTVPVNVSGNDADGFSAVVLEVSFDRDVLELQGVSQLHYSEVAPIIPVYTPTVNTPTGPTAFDPTRETQWVSLARPQLGPHQELANYNGPIVDLVFRVINDPADGIDRSTPITIGFPREPIDGRPARAYGDGSVLISAWETTRPVTIPAITDPPPLFIPVTDIPTPATPVHAGTTHTLAAVALPHNATVRAIEWDVINPRATGARIDGNIFTASGVGTATIRATVAGGSSPVGGPDETDFTRDFDIVVTEAAPPALFVPVDLIPRPATPIEPGETIPLVTEALPDDATNRAIRWQVIDPGATRAEIITGNSYSFTAQREGTATVRATVLNGAVDGGRPVHFTRDFEIVVASAAAGGGTGTPPGGTPPGGTGPGGTTPGGTAPADHPFTTAPPAGVTRPSGAGNLTILDHFGTWTGRGTRTARVDANHNTFQRLWFGDRIVMPAHLTIASGSTSITLSEEFIRHLRDGTYSFVAEFEGGHATLTLIVSRAFGNVPQTGVADVTLATIVMGISLLLTLTVGVLLFFHLRAKRSGSDSGGATIEKVRSRSNE